MQRLMWQRAASGAVAMTLALGLVACSSDEASDDGDEPTEESAGGLGAEACDLSVGIQAAMAGAPQDPAEMGPFIEGDVLPQVEELRAAVPEDLAPAVDDLAAGLEQLAGGDMAVFESPDYLGAQETLGAAVHDGCDATQVDVTAVDYAYEGVPSRIDAGLTSFALTNEGVEDHEIVVFKANEGADEPLEELLELPEEEMMSKLTFTGVAFGGPGTTSYAALDLEPGTYHLVCFIPTGGGEEGPPHFMEGMQQTITVA